MLVKLNLTSESRLQEMKMGGGVAEREREVAEVLKVRGLPPISAQGGRCLLLPTRNLETWLYWLTAQRHGSSLEAGLIGHAQIHEIDLAGLWFSFHASIPAFRPRPYCLMHFA